MVVVSDPGQPAFSGGADGPVAHLGYDELLAGQPADYEWPELDERSAAAICYTSGTTGIPRGVAYSHRSTFLHAFSPVLRDRLSWWGRGQSLAAGAEGHILLAGPPQALQGGPALAHLAQQAALGQE